MSDSNSVTLQESVLFRRGKFGKRLKDLWSNASNTIWRRISAITGANVTRRQAAALVLLPVTLILAAGFSGTLSLCFLFLVISLILSVPLWK